MSWSTDMSPTALFGRPDSARVSRGDTRAGEGVPGVVRPGGYLGGAIPGTYPAGQIKAYLWNIEVESVHTTV